KAPLPLGEGFGVRALPYGYEKRYRRASEFKDFRSSHLSTNPESHARADSVGKSPTMLIDNSDVWDGVSDDC
ncbi:MAG: hypothetical protein P5700_23785, partial [Arthrospira platensis PCC 7345]|nr:hypothetical protein [Arthrospira platensis PCC 7345]